MGRAAAEGTLRLPALQQAAQAARDVTQATGAQGGRVVAARSALGRQALKSNALLRASNALAPSAASRAVTAGVAKAAAPLTAAQMVYETGALALDPERRAARIREAEQMASQGAGSRVLSGVSNPVATLFGVGTQAGMAQESQERARRSQARFDVESRPAIREARRQQRETTLPGYNSPLLQERRRRAAQLRASL